MFKTLIVLAGLLCLSVAVPVYLVDFEGIQELQQLGLELHGASLYDVEDGGLRVRRSPQKIGLTGSGSIGGPGTIRADATTPQWTSNNGRHSLQGNGYYQRNFNTPGPRQDWGAGATYTFRF